MCTHTVVDAILNQTGRKKKSEVYTELYFSRSTCISGYFRSMNTHIMDVHMQSGKKCGVMQELKSCLGLKHEEEKDKILYKMVSSFVFIKYLLDELSLCSVLEGLT